MRKLVLILALAICTVLALSQGGGKVASEISSSRAISTAGKFLRDIGVPQRQLTNPKARFEISPILGRRWVVMFDSGHNLEVNAKTDHVILYINSRRRLEQYENRGRTGKRFFHSPAQAKAYLRELATKAGVPKSVALQTFHYYGDGQVHDANSAGVVEAGFNDTSRRILWGVCVDPQDGVPTYIEETHYRPQPRNPVRE